MKLEVKDASLSFGGLKVIDGLNLTVESQSIVGLIGPNGAGKTTAFNLISGIYKPNRGEIQLNGESLLKLRPFEVSRRGIVRTFQNIRLFANLSVVDNILVSMHPKCTYSVFSTWLQTPSYFKHEAEFRARALELLNFFGLNEWADAEAGSLPYGLQRKIEILRALAGGPQVLLLDEPAAGMNESETASLLKLIREIRSKMNTAILLIEHDMKLVMQICDRVIVLDHGVVIAEGTPTQVQKNARVIEAYLGCEEV